jgi:hypothetical protein
VQSLRDKLHLYEIKCDEQEKQIDDLEQEVFITKVKLLLITLTISSKLIFNFIN